MNPSPHRPTPTGFSPAQAALLLLAAICILSLMGFVLINGLRLLNAPPAASTVAADAPEGDAAVISAVGVPTLSQIPATLLPSPTLYPSAAPTITNSPTPSPSDCLPPGAGISLGVVRDVLSGDTLVVESAGELIQVGYTGLSAPAPALSAASLQALEKNRQLLAGQDVVLVQGGEDVGPDGRRLRYVFFENGSRFANYELVRQGYASAVETADVACQAVFQAAEQTARAERVGLWAPTPVPTATFLPTVAIDPRKNAPCDCAVRWQCTDFNTHASAQACFNACEDYSSKLDEDHDGLACEDLP